MIIYVFDCQFEVFGNSNAGKNAELHIYIYIYVCVNTVQREQKQICALATFPNCLRFLWDFYGIFAVFDSGRPIFCFLLDFNGILLVFVEFLWWLLCWLNRVCSRPICGIFLVFFGNLGIVMVFAFGLPKFTDQIVELPWLQSK